MDIFKTSLLTICPKQVYLGFNKQNGRINRKGFSLVYVGNITRNSRQKYYFVGNKNSYQNCVAPYLIM